MSWIAPLLGAVQAGVGLYGQYKQHKYEKRAAERGPRESRVSQFTPEQQHYFDLINSIITGEGEKPKGGLLGEVYGDEGFNAYADPAIRKFNEEIVPGLAERFSGAFGTGAAGAQSSSAFQNALAGAGQDLARGLGEFRQQQRMQSLGGLTNQFLQPREHIDIQPRNRESTLGQGLIDFGKGGASTFFNQLMNWLQEKYGSNPTVGAPKSPVQQGSYINKQGQITGPMY